MMEGVVEMTLREASRRVNCDVKALHTRKSGCVPDFSRAYFQYNLLIKQYFNQSHKCAANNCANSRTHKKAVAYHPSYT